MATPFFAAVALAGNFLAADSLACAFVAPAFAAVALGAVVLGAVAFAVGALVAFGAVVFGAVAVAVVAAVAFAAVAFGALALVAVGAVACLTDLAFGGVSFAAGALFGAAQFAGGVTAPVALETVGPAAASFAERALGGTLTTAVCAACRVAGAFLGGVIRRRYRVQLMIAAAACTSLRPSLHSAAGQPHVGQLGLCDRRNPRAVAPLRGRGA